MNKKRIGVVTFYRYNYGGFLQAYGLQRTLLKLNYEAELLQYDYLSDKTILGIPYINIKKPIRFIESMIVAIMRLKKNKEKNLTFAEGAERNLRESKCYNSSEKLLREKLDYDIMISGSDQVFNPLIHPQGLKVRMLDFKDFNGKRVSYAASVGVENIDNKKEKYIGKQIKRFDKISVREENAKKILQKYTDKNIEQHIDPSFLLEMEEWKNFSMKLPLNLNKPFIFVHLINRDENIIRFVEKMAKEKNYSILTSDSREIFDKTIIIDRALAPEQFVRAIKEAEYVVTNSFHGTAFSIIFKKKARIYVPTQAGARIKNILDKFNLWRLTEDRYLNIVELSSLYEKAGIEIEKERKRAVGYLRNL